MYCTQDDILDLIDERQLIQLTDDTHAGVVDSAVVTRMVEDADAEIDGYLAKRFAVPVDPVPGALRKVSVDIAIYNLFSRRNIDDEVRTRRYDQALKKLEQVAAGKMTLGIQPPPDPPADPDDGVAIQVNARPPVFGTDTMDKF